ncbi:MAG: hypothetical protein QOJ09_2281, partial [Actinomycetota bacterium]|nr:hypothetical protein [Actinomycetota bacterium]
MAFGIVHRFAGGTKQQYENTVAVVHPDGGKSLPAGQTLHLAGATADGWIVVAIWDSQGSFETFRDDILVPGLTKTTGGLPGPPDETTFEGA